jgi:hypothetical protein
MSGRSLLPGAFRKGMEQHYRLCDGRYCRLSREQWKGLPFQAVESNTSVAPVKATASVCTAATAKNPPSCYWNRLIASATGNHSGGGTLTGTYSVQSNGSGAVTATPSGNPTVAFAIIVRGTSSLGQEVPMVAMPQLGNEFRGSGSAVRVK